jgi:SnoaL-like domain
MELWELEAREAIRDTMAMYTHAGDTFPLVNLAGAFCEDGVLEPEGEEPVIGRAAIEQFRAAARQRSGVIDQGRLLRHNVANVRFESVTPEKAVVSSYYTVFTEIGVDHMGRYRDRFVCLGGNWLIAHKFVTCDWRAEGSRF